MDFTSIRSYADVVNIVQVYDDGYRFEPIPVGTSRIEIPSLVGSENGYLLKISDFNVTIEPSSDFTLVDFVCEGDPVIYCHADVSFHPMQEGESPNALLTTTYTVTDSRDQVFGGDIYIYQETFHTLLYGLGLPSDDNSSPPQNGIQYQIIKSVINPEKGQIELNADSVRMQPSFVHCAKNSTAASDIKRTRVVMLQCVDKTTQAHVSGCSVGTGLTMGSDKGGHDHGGGVRPLGDLTPVAGNFAIPVDGLVINYAAPEVSGSYVLGFNAVGGDGNPIAVAPTTF
jgi:hypothetical protein